MTGSRGAAAVCAAAAALTCLVAVPASAGSPLAYTVTGTPVGVGDVVGRGAVSGGLCTFAAPVEVLLDRAGTVSLTATDDCLVVVSGITVAGAGPSTVGTFVLPAAPDPTGLGLSGGGDVAATAGDPVSPRVGKIWQDAFDLHGSWQAGSYFSVNFGRDQRTGALVAPEAGYGQCTANSYPTGVADTDMVETTAPTSCSWSVPQHNADSFELRGYGVFSHRVLGIEDAQFSLDASLYAYRNTDTDIDPACAIGVLYGSWPRGWTTACTAVEEEGVQ